MASLLPIERMRTRVTVDRDDSDVAYFFGLLYLGELVSKLVVSAFAAGLSDDNARSRYAVIHGLIRADGIGDWANAIDAGRWSVRGPR